jgi:hypothetical protein
MMFYTLKLDHIWLYKTQLVTNEVTKRIECSVNKILESSSDRQYRITNLRNRLIKSNKKINE